MPKPNSPSWVASTSRNTSLSFSSTVSLSATPDIVWQALTDPLQIARYHLAPLKIMESAPGGRIIYGTETAELISGKILNIVPGKLLIHTFQFVIAESKSYEDPPTIVSYQLEPTISGTRLTLNHSGFPEENQTYADISGGWPHILSSLQAFLREGQTGK